MNDVTNNTDIATLPPAERAVIALGSSKAEEQIKEFLAEAKDVTTVTDKAGRELAHKVGMKLKNARTSIEKIGKAAREDAQAFSKAVISEEKRLIGLMSNEEDRIFKLRDEFDAKERAEKEAKERAERERVAAIQAKIDAIRALPAQSVNDSAEELAATLEDLQAMEIAEADFQELTEEAAKARHQAMGELRTMLDGAQARAAAQAALAEEQARLSAEAERLAAERAELERMRAEIEAMKGKAAVTIPAGVLTEDELNQAAGQAGVIVVEKDTVTDDLFGANQTIDPQDVQDAKNASVRAILDAVTVGTGATKTTFDEGGHVVVENVSIGVDLASGGDQTVVINAGDPDEFDNAKPGDTINFDGAIDADALVQQLATFTSLQFMAMAKKVAAVGASTYAAELRGIAERLAAGEFHVQLKTADWTAMADADKEMALASHACVSMILGDDAMGASTLREAIAA